MYENDIRVMNTPSLIALVEDSSENGYNRTIEPAWIKRYADHAGYHVASVLIHNHKARTDTLRPHHRVQIMVKTPDSMYPTTIIIDVTATAWSWLYTIDEWKAMEEEAQKVDPDYVSVGKRFGRVKFNYV
jgi:hypothetical protein